MFRNFPGFFSRISIRMLVFNILLVFLPIAGFLYLDTYEKQLLKALEHALVQQARLLASALSEHGELNPQDVEIILLNLQQRHEARLRVVNSSGLLLADSSKIFQTTENAKAEALGKGNRSIDNTDVQQSLLYRFASFPIRIYRRYLRPPQPPLESGEYYSQATNLMGEEIREALEGRYGAVTRISSGGQVSVTLYSAIPIWSNRTVMGAALVSQSTYRILRDLYLLRLDIFRIFLLSLAAAIGLSLFLSGTIAGPVRQLRNQAKAILDSRGRLTGHILRSKRQDEIGDLSHTLQELTVRLKDHIGFVESFASDVSHEFKNPLASIRAAAEMVMEIDVEAQRKRFLELILKDVARMEHLLTGVREISHIDSHLNSEKRQKVDTKALIESIVEAVRLRGDPKKVKFDIKVPEETINLFVAPERLARVFENLIDNAVTFSPLGGTVEIFVSRSESAVVVAVSDQGPGVPEQNLELIFHRFFSARTNKTRGANHTGLGLAIAKAIVEGYGGSIAANNLAVRGARFEVKLPV